MGKLQRVVADEHIFNTAQSKDVGGDGTEQEQVRGWIIQQTGKGH